MLQHNYACRIRERLKVEDWTFKRYASEAQIEYDRLVRMLRGEVVMRLEDIALADELLKGVSEWSHRAMRNHAKALEEQREKEARQNRAKR